MTYSVVHDHRDKFREGASLALLMRAGFSKPDYGNEYSNGPQKLDSVISAFPGHAAILAAVS